MGRSSLRKGCCPPGRLGHDGGQPHAAGSSGSELRLHGLRAPASEIRVSHQLWPLFSDGERSCPRLMASHKELCRGANGGVWQRHSRLPQSNLDDDVAQRGAGFELCRHRSESGFPAGRASSLRQALESLSSRWSSTHLCATSKRRRRQFM